MTHKKDYAKMAHMDEWLRHPVLGDPSFDTFQRLGDTVHRSEPPFEWAVNGTLFRDFDDVWYYYAGLYAHSYAPTRAPKFKIYRSADRGQHWEDLGWGFEDGFRFDGDASDSDTCPDAVVFYDPKEKKYLMTYDTCANDYQHDPDGAALAWADTPAGPFHRLPHRFVTNGEDTRCGKYVRYYASTVVPREKDYIGFLLADSGPYYAWALMVTTAPSVDGPWTKPEIVLNCDRDEYFPCPVEFFPTQIHNGIAYCPATSVAMNRNFQVLFEAPLEEAHRKEAWRMTANGNLWHSRDHTDEYKGIWGQTYHGFIEPDTGRYVVMFPAKDARDYGTLSVATRPWDQPHSDGFTLTSHDGPSVAPILRSYRDFILEAKFRSKGTVDFAFAYEGTLGPNDSTSDAVPAKESLRGYSALRLQEGKCAVISLAQDGSNTIHAETSLESAPESLKMEWQGSNLTVILDGEMVFKQLSIPSAVEKTAPLALVLDTFSRIDCEEFIITGEDCDVMLTFNATDALLGAGQLHPEDATVAPYAEIAPDRWHRIPGGYVSEGNVAAKWNIPGRQFLLPLPKNPAFGTAGIWIDGQYQGSLDLCGEGEAVFTSHLFPMGYHSLRIAPLDGRIAITKLQILG